MKFDLIIKNGYIVDGTGNPPFISDIGIISDRISTISNLSDAEAGQIIDASNLVVAPGFIDTHVHSEIALLGFGHRYGSVLQGVTTQFLSPDGFGWAGLPEDLAAELWETTQFCYGKADLVLNWPSPESYLNLFPNRSPANVVPQAPHCAIRLRAMGWDARPASKDELEIQKRALREWMDAGAVGLSLGLDYQPSAYASTDELSELSLVLKEYEGVYNAHIRNNILGREGAWLETFEIGRKSGSKMHIAHEYVNEVTGVLLDQADSQCDLSFESYLYPAGSTHFPQFSMPTWAQQGGEKGIRERLKDPDARRKIRDHLEKVLTENYATGAKQVISANQTGRFVGLTVEEAASKAGESLGDFAIRTLEEEVPYTLTINHRPGGDEVHDEMIRQTAQHEKTIIASDGIYHGPHPHPRAFGCHTRVLRLCVRERNLLSLQEAIHKMTGKPAERFGIAERGRLAPNYFADLVLFDPENVSDRSTWEQPLLEPIGINQVFVNGKSVVKDGVPTGILPGQVARRKA